MYKYLILIALLLPFFGDDAEKGRKGNKRYVEQNYEEAARLFREGIEALTDRSRDHVRTGLHNNLGCALNKLQSYDDAAAAFEAAIQSATTPEGRSRSSYNAGNTAFQSQNIAESLDYYRDALLSAPDNENARFNYEFVRRLVDQQQQQQQDPDQQQQQQEQEEESDGEQEQQQQQQDQEQQQEQEQQQGDQDQEQPADQPEPQPSEIDEERDMSRRQAEQILEALENDEEELLKQVWRMRGKTKPVDKDW